MNLSEIISNETRVSTDAVMFLRHGNDIVKRLQKYGVTVEEYTCIQQPGSKYDFHHPMRSRILVVVVISDDHVYGVFRVGEIDATGTSHTVPSAAFKRYEAELDSPVPEYNVHKFHLEILPSICTGLSVRGWEKRARTPVQRQGDGFFTEIEVGPAVDHDVRASVEQAFEKLVAASRRDNPAARAQRLAIAAPAPKRVAVTSYIFARNPDVVAEVLNQSNGHCQVCGKPAPFARRSDSSPYLEVHHRISLASGGMDTVDNAIAACPNCHRKAHYA